MLFIFSPQESRALKIIQSAAVRFHYLHLLPLCGVTGSWTLSQNTTSETACAVIKLTVEHTHDTCFKNLLLRIHFGILIDHVMV